MMRIGSNWSQVIRFIVTNLEADTRGFFSYFLTCNPQNFIKSMELCAKY
jgi:hypothetical protein